MPTAKIKVPSGNRNKQVHANRKKSISDLIAILPKNISGSTYFDDNESYIRYAEYMMRFIKSDKFQLDKSRLDTLKFSPEYNTIYDLIYSLEKIILDQEGLKMVIETVDENTNVFKCFHVYEEITTSDDTVLFVEVAPIKKYSEKMQIGYAYFLDNFSKILYKDFWTQRFFPEDGKPENHMMSHEIDWWIESDSQDRLSCYEDDDNPDGGPLTEEESEAISMDIAEESLMEFQELQELVNQNLKKDYQEFLDYKPDEKEKALHDLIVYLNQHLDSFHKPFSELLEFTSDEYSPYDLFDVIWDFENQFCEGYTNGRIESVNNGWGYFTSSVTITEDNIKFNNTDEDYKIFREVIKKILELCLLN